MYSDISENKTRLDFCSEVYHELEDTVYPASSQSSQSCIFPSTLAHPFQSPHQANPEASSNNSYNYLSLSSVLLPKCTRPPFPTLLGFL